MTTFYDVTTEQDQRGVIAQLQELYKIQMQRVMTKLTLEMNMLRALSRSEGADTPMRIMQALSTEEEIDRALRIQRVITSILTGIEAARRAAPTPEGHPTAQGIQSVQTGARTEVKLNL